VYLRNNGSWKMLTKQNKNKTEQKQLKNIFPTFSKRFYLFERERERKSKSRGKGRGGGRGTGEKESSRGEGEGEVDSPLLSGLIPGPCGHDLNQRQTLNQLSHPVALMFSTFTVTFMFA